MESATASDQAILAAAVKEGAALKPPVSVIGVARLLTLDTPRKPAMTAAATEAAGSPDTATTSPVDIDIIGRTAVEAARRRLEAAKQFMPDAIPFNQYRF